MYFIFFYSKSIIYLFIKNILFLLVLLKKIIYKCFRFNYSPLEEMIENIYLFEQIRGHELDSFVLTH